jgi:hypothetical protein
VTSEFLDAGEYPIEALQGSSSVTFFFTVILFSLVCPVWMVGACRWLLMVAQCMSLALGGSVHRDVLLGMPLFVYFHFRILSFFRLIRSERPRYLNSDLCRARSSRTGNFIFPNVCPRGSVLVRGMRFVERIGDSY